MYSKERLQWIFSGCAVILSLLLILSFTLFDRRGDSAQETVLIPFFSFIEAQVQPEMYRSMLMNVVLFVPLGLSLPFVLPDKVRRKVLWTVLIGMALSICIEASQYIFALGRCETDDVIMNTLGMLIGASSYPLYQLLSSWIAKKKSARSLENHNESRS